MADSSAKALPPKEDPKVVAVRHMRAYFHLYEQEYLKDSTLNVTKFNKWLLEQHLARVARAKAAFDAKKGGK